MSELLKNPAALAGWALFAAAALVSVLAIVGYFRRHRLLSRQFEKENALLEERLQLIRERRTSGQVSGPGWEGFANFMVTKKVLHGESGICSFYLKPKDERLELAPFLPGQHLIFKLPVAGSSKPLTRRYSLSDRPGLGLYRISVKLASPPRDKPDAPEGKGSGYFHRMVEAEGTSALPSLIQVSSPAGSFVLDPLESKPVVLIAGGVGLTPMLSMFNSVIDTNVSREAWLYYAIRNGDENILFDEGMLHPDFEKLVGARDNLHVHVFHSAIKSKEELPACAGEAHCGRLTVDALKKCLPSNNYRFYICGPEPMMDQFERELEEWGVPEEDILSERFSPPSKRKADGPPAEGKVQFAKSAKEAEMGPDDVCILDLAERAGVPIAYDCRAGSCGQCKVSLVSGKVNYNIRTNYKCPPGSCLTCCSVPEGEVVLDC